MWLIQKECTSLAFHRWGTSGFTSCFYQCPLDPGACYLSALPPLALSSRPPDGFHSLRQHFHNQSRKRGKMHQTLPARFLLEIEATPETPSRTPPSSHLPVQYVEGTDHQDSTGHFLLWTNTRVSQPEKERTDTRNALPSTCRTPWSLTEAVLMLRLHKCQAWSCGRHGSAQVGPVGTSCSSNSLALLCATSLTEGEQENTCPRSRLCMLRTSEASAYHFLTFGEETVCRRRQTWPPCRRGQFATELAAAPRFLHAV